jgi:hypothetical protein
MRLFTSVEYLHHLLEQFLEFLVDAYTDTDFIFFRIFDWNFSALSPIPHHFVQYTGET